MCFTCVSGVTCDMIISYKLDSMSLNVVVYNYQIVWVYVANGS